jgi:ATP-dependent helicase/nuclease subunit A
VRETAVISDAAARQRAIDPTRSFIVQAPAGSGKTELLTQRYLRLLATVDAPEQILALTFTRKAAAEMRTRILQAVDAAQGAPPTQPHKRLTWDLARAVREADARHGWSLLQHPARLRIQTIDALNASLARRLPVLAGTGAALEPTGDPFPLYELAARRLIERLGEDSAVAEQLEVLIVHLGNRVDRIVELLCDLLAKRDQWLHPIMRARGTENLRGALEGTLQALVERHLRLLCDAFGVARCLELTELLEYSANNLLADDKTSAARREMLEAALAHLRLDADRDCLPAWRAISAMLLKQDGELYASITARQGFPTTNREMKSRMLDLLKELGEEPHACESLLELRALPDPFYSEAQWRTLEALLELLPAAVVELQAVFQVHGKADYVEVALRALQSLGPADEPTDLALAFDHRLQHILVDEFQDTSFAQLDLLERLTAGWVDGDGRTLFCVGDPMQSIYRFRQAEVGLFIELQRHGLRDLRLEPLRLETNFRSMPQIIEWVNQVFPSVLDARSDAEQGAVQYSPSVAAREGEGAVRVHPLVDADSSAEAQRVVEVVQSALAQDEDGRVAVLVTARTHVAAIARALAEARIAFQAIEIEQLRERPVVQDLMALTRALVHVADRTAWLAVLRAPWCGLSLSDLHVLSSRPEPTLEAALAGAMESPGEELTDDGRLRLARVQPILHAALAERGRWSLCDWVERTWNALCGPATLQRAEDLSDAQAYLERLAELDEAGDLDDPARLDEQLMRLFANAQVHDDVRVEVMTVHAAKGLEFETVILPGLQRRIRAEDRELMRWTRVAGLQSGFLLAPIKAAESDSDPIYRWIELLERQRILRERARLLYVAVTRAKRELHLLGTVQTRERDGEISVVEPQRGSMLRMLWHAVADEFNHATPTAAKPSQLSESSRHELRRLPVQWQPPELAEVTYDSAIDVVDIEEEQPPFDWVSLTSRHVGTLVHRELERYARATAPESVPMPAACRERFMVELLELGVPADRCDAAANRVVAALEHTLADERGRWVLGWDGGVRDAESELALSSVQQGRIVEGIIDRTFVDHEGVRWIVDFKTSTHEGGGLELFLSEEVARYRAQLQRYAALIRAFNPGQAVRAALYFPLIRAWREVEV